MSYVLASATWCRNCGPVKLMMNQMGINFQVLDVDSEDDEAQLPEGLRGIPALIEDGKVVATGQDGIRMFLNGVDK